MQYEVKVLPLDVKVNLDDGTFAGYCAGYGNIDSYGDRLLPGSHEEAIIREPEQVKIFAEHGWIDGNLPIGKALSFEGREDGLYTEGKVFPTMEGKDVLLLIKEEVMTGLSIGWRPIEWKIVEEEGKSIREVSKYSLREYSVVSFGANDFARITGVKGRVGVKFYSKEDLTDSNIPSENVDKLVELVKQSHESDPLSVVLDEVLYIKELTSSITEVRDDQVRQALDELNAITLILKSKLKSDDLLVAIREATTKINEACRVVAS